MSESKHTLLSEAIDVLEYATNGKQEEFFLSEEYISGRNYSASFVRKYSEEESVGEQYRIWFEIGSTVYNIQHSPVATFMVIENVTGKQDDEPVEEENEENETEEAPQEETIE